MLDKKQIQVIFLFMFKMGHKAVETTCNINNAFGPGTTNKQCSGHSRNFGKEMRTLKMRSTVVSHQQSSKLILLQPPEKLTKNSMSTIRQSFSI